MNISDKDTQNCERRDYSSVPAAVSGIGIGVPAVSGIGIGVPVVAAAACVWNLGIYNAVAKLVGDVGKDEKVV